MLGLSLRGHALLSAYSYAVSEENASGGIIATAPTCGGSGSVPAPLYASERELETQPK